LIKTGENTEKLTAKGDVCTQAQSMIL